VVVYLNGEEVGRKHLQPGQPGGALPAGGVRDPEGELIILKAKIEWWVTR